MKRYFIEIVGVDPNRGIAQLVEAGIQPNRILEVDECNQMSPVIDAIMSVSGVTWAEIAGTKRNHKVIVARIIYVYNAIKRGRTTKEICEEIKKAKSMVRWYETRYSECFRFDPAFKKVAQKIEEVIASTKKPKDKKPKDKKPKDKKPKEKLTPEEIEEILDKRQLRIDFDNIDNTI